MLSPSKHANRARGSPTKQNISPSRLPSSKQQKQKQIPSQLLLSAIHQLQCMVMKLGGTVPAHLNFGFTNRIDLIKQNQDQGTLLAEIRNLKIKLSNTQFQLKKKQQDEAQYKILSKLDRQKQQKRLKTQIQKLETQLKQQNHKWQLKFTEMRTNYEQANQQNNFKIIKKYTQQIEKLNNQYLTQISQLKKRYQRIVDDLKISNGEQIQGLRRRYQIDLQGKQREIQEQRQKGRIKNVQIIQKMQRKQQQMQTAFQSEKKTDKKKQDQQKISFSKTKQKLYNDIYLVRKQKQQLSKKISQLSTQILTLQSEIQKLKQQLAQQAQHSSQKQEKISLSHTYEIEKIRHRHKLELEDLYREFKKKNQYFQETVGKIEGIRLEREQVLRQAMEGIERMFHERPARQEDRGHIQKLNYQIMIKQQQLINTKNQLKQMKLERENNQKNYTKIFASVPKERQKLTDRSQRPQTATYSRQKDRERDRQKIYRTANTVDMNFLLKVCNRNF